MDEIEYRRLREEFEAEYRKNIEALDWVWRAAKKSSPRSTQTTSARGALQEAVCTAIDGIGGTFTTHDVERKLKQQSPGLRVRRASVSTVLKRLVDKNILERTELGKGKRPSSYRIIEAELK